MVLIILFLYFNVFTFSLNRNTDFQDVISRSEQLDADRNAEQIRIIYPATTGIDGQIVVSCTLINTGSVSVQLARLWIQDKNLTQNNVGSISLTAQSIALQPGSSRMVTFNTININGAASTHTFYLWIVTLRGNVFSIFINLGSAT